MKLVPSRLRHLTREAAGSSFALLQGSQPVVSQRGAKAESVARERGRPVEPDPGNAGEGKLLHHPFRMPAFRERHFYDS